MHQNLINKTPHNIEQRALEIKLLVGLLFVICVAVLAAHWLALSATAMCPDDSEYLHENALVQNPSWASAQRFLTEVLKPSTVRGYYQPLAMISLMLDYSLGGRPDNLTQFHLTSLGLHAANTMLIVIILYLLFGQIWAAAAVGLLFGVHPMTVEPIPWVGERKTLLAAFFSLWCLVLYVLFTRKKDWKLYGGCMVMYVLALMSKPTSIPIPAFMMVMDYWPLKRFKWRDVLNEKLPFFVVGSISAIITYISQKGAAGVILPAESRLEHIWLIPCHNIIFYLFKIIWPANLSLHYVLPQQIRLSEPMMLAGLIGTCILIPLLLLSLRWTRALAAGWIIFFIGILPTMQIVRFSNVIASDKFVYLPSMGLLMILAWLLSRFCCGKYNIDKLMARHISVAVVIVTIAGAETVATRQYLGHWRDTTSLVSYMLTITPNSAPLYDMLGVSFKLQGKIDEAITQYRKALEADPNYAAAHINLGVAVGSQGKLDESIGYFRRAIQLDPDSSVAQTNLGIALGIKGKLNESIFYLRQALQAEPDSAVIHTALGVALRENGNLEEAISHFRQALQLDPHSAKLYNNLGVALRLQGKLDDAINHFRQALQLEPNSVKVRYNLAGALQAQGSLEEALAEYQRVLESKQQEADIRCIMGDILVQLNRRQDAVTQYREALKVNPDHPKARQALENLSK